MRMFSTQALAAGLLASFVGFAGSFAVIVQGLTAVGASPAQAGSGLMALSIAMGLCGILLSLRLRMPISVAWSTPGGALLATSGAVPGGFGGAVGAFIVTGLLIVLCGLWRPLGRLVAAIPPVLANAMLAGVLLGLCLAPMRAVAAVPHLALPVILVWAVVARFDRRFAVPAAVVLAAVLVALSGTVAPAGASLWLAPVLVAPQFSLQGVIGISLPLFIVTMASQNIPGMAVLHVNGYRPAPGGLFTATGVFSLLAAPFGGHAVNLAAITAALCAGPEAHADPARRYWAAVVAGAFYVGFGLLAGAAKALIIAAPPILIEAVAGLALLGALGAALMGAVSVPHEREAAVVTFLVTASGLSFFGIAGAFWGLLAGGALLLSQKWR
jgi:benzoate membrane transport protein